MYDIKREERRIDEERGSRGKQEISDKDLSEPIHSMSERGG